jgi:hypothetical protein
MAAPTAEPTGGRMAAPTAEPMEAQTVVQMAARTVGLDDA